MRTTVALIAAGLALGVAAPAAAQSWSGRYNTGSGHDRVRSNWAPSAFDWRDQLDRPGDYRCDAFWDANRNDCGDRWRDQRHRTRYGYAHANRGYGYDLGYSRYGHGYGDWRRRGYGSAGYGQGYASQGAAWYGAYGRPDLVYPGGGGGWNGARDARRVEWCRWNYRSYDPASGYYRAYSGRLVFCG
jgi:hypothetical protein